MTCYGSIETGKLYTCRLAFWWTIRIFHSLYSFRVGKKLFNLHVLDSKDYFSYATKFPIPQGIKQH